MTDQASFKDGGSRVDNRCELPTILSLQALDGLSAPESRIQAVPETAEAGAPMNRDLRNCCDPYLNHAERGHGSKAGYSSGWLGSTPGGRRAQIRGLRAGARWLLPPRPQPQLLSPARVATLNHAQVLPPLRRQLLGRTRIESTVPRGSRRRRTRPAIPRRGSPTAWRAARRAASRSSPGGCAG